VVLADFRKAKEITQGTLSANTYATYEERYAYAYVGGFASHIVEVDTCIRDVTLRESHVPASLSGLSRRVKPANFYPLSKSSMMILMNSWWLYINNLINNNSSSTTTRVGAA
jgi:hypothetical protein